MLQSIRDRTHGWIAGIVISILILSFALWGISSYFLGGAANNVVAKVNEIDITRAQLNATYERLRRQIQLKSNTNYETSVQAESEIRHRALESLINIQALKQASIKQNYRISIRQVDTFLESMPEFQQNGQFSTEKLQQVLSATLYTPVDFLGLIKTTLLIDQPRLGIIFTSYSLPNEISEMVSLINQQRHFRYVVLPLQLNQTISIPEDKIITYYQQHQDNFKKPEQVSVEYIQLSMQDLMKSVNPTDEMIKAFYRDNYSSKPLEEVKNKVKEELIHQRAEEKFAELKEKLTNITYEHPDSLQLAATTLNLPIHTTGLFAKEEGNKDEISMNNNVREVAFGNDVLNLRNNSDVIQLDSNSVIVLRVKSHQPAAQLPLQSVKAQIIEQFKANEIDIKTANLADEITKKLQSGRLSAEQAAGQYHLAWIDSGLISRHSTKINSAILEAAFAMPKPKKELFSYTVIKISNGYVIIQLKDIQNGALSTKSDPAVFAEQAQNAQGVMEYELYKQSLIRQAKIIIQNA
jgi:peptidyl-prolyl cis-trans isomerase D